MTDDWWRKVRLQSVDGVHSSIRTSCPATHRVEVSCFSILVVWYDRDAVLSDVMEKQTPQDSNQDAVILADQVGQSCLGLSEISNLMSWLRFPDPTSQDQAVLAQEVLKVS